MRRSLPPTLEFDSSCLLPRRRNGWRGDDTAWNFKVVGDGRLLMGTRRGVEATRVFVLDCRPGEEPSPSKLSIRLFSWSNRARAVKSNFSQVVHQVGNGKFQL